MPYKDPERRRLRESQRKEKLHRLTIAARWADEQIRTLRGIGRTFTKTEKKKLRKELVGAFLKTGDYRAVEAPLSAPLPILPE